MRKFSFVLNRQSSPKPLDWKNSKYVQRLNEILTWNDNWVLQRKEKSKLMQRNLKIICKRYLCISYVVVFVHRFCLFRVINTEIIYTYSCKTWSTIYSSSILATQTRFYRNSFKIHQKLISISNKFSLSLVFFCYFTMWNKVYLILHTHKICNLMHVKRDFEFNLQKLNKVKSLFSSTLQPYFINVFNNVAHYLYTENNLFVIKSTK